MGNEQSVPAAAAANDSAKDQNPAVTGTPSKEPHHDVPELAENNALAIETDISKFNDGLPTPPPTLDDPPPELVAPSAPIGIPRSNTEAKDKRPAFLRRLTTAPSVVLTAKTHAETVTATPTSLSPEKTLRNGAREQLNTVNTTRSRSAIKDKDDYFPTPQPAFEANSASLATRPPDLSLDSKELAQSLSSLESETRFDGDRRELAPRSGSVSPLSCDFVGNGTSGQLDDEGSGSQMTAGIPTPPRETSFDRSRPASFSVDDWAWRMEFAPSEASEDDDIDPEFCPLPDGDDESFADDELSYLEPGRESALRGESRDEDHNELARIQTSSSTESTEKAASLHAVQTEMEEQGEQPPANATIAGVNAEIEEVAQEDALKEIEISSERGEQFERPRSNENHALEGSETVQETEVNEVEDPGSKTAEHSGEESEREEGSVGGLEDQAELSSSQPALKSPDVEARHEDIIAVDNRRDSAMYQLSFEPKDMEHLQTIKEPEPADSKKRMSLASIEDVAGELSVAELRSEETPQQRAHDDAMENKNSFEGTFSAHTSILDRVGDNFTSQAEKDATSIQDQPTHDDTKSTKDEVEESLQVEEFKQHEEQVASTESRPSQDDARPTENGNEQSKQVQETTEKLDESPLDSEISTSERPATAHPFRAPAETSNRPLTAPSNSAQLSEAIPIREKSKSWRKTWPILGNRAVRSKGKESAEAPGQEDADEILPVAPARSKNPEKTQQEPVQPAEQPAPKPTPKVADDSSKPSSGPGLVSKIPTPAKKSSKSKDKKKRGSILGSIFRHHSTAKEDKSKSKENAKSEKPKDKESKPSKRNSKIAKVYRRSTKRQETGGDLNDAQKEAPKSSGSATATTVLGSPVVAEPEPLKSSSVDDTVEPPKREGVLNDADEGQRSASAGKGKYALPSASLGIPTLLQSPVRRRQSQDQGQPAVEHHWYQRRSATPQPYPQNDPKPLRRGSMGVAESADRKRSQSNLPQARPGQPQSRRASVHVLQPDPSQRHSIGRPPPPRAQPLLLPADDSPYTRANTGIPQRSTSKISSYANKNPPYRGIARTNSSPIQAMSSAQQQPQPLRVASRIPSLSLSQGPGGRYHVAQRLPGPPRMVDVRRSNTFSLPSHSRSGSLSPGIEQSVPEESQTGDDDDNDVNDDEAESAGLAISSSRPIPSETVVNTAKNKSAGAARGGQCFVAELADTDVGRRGSEEITMRATSYPGMEWVPEAVE